MHRFTLHDILPKVNVIQSFQNWYLQKGNDVIVNALYVYGCLRLSKAIDVSFSTSILEVLVPEFIEGREPWLLACRSTTTPNLNLDSIMKKKNN